MADLSKNSIHRVMISGYSSQGAGIARIDDFVVFVREGIMGEVCDIRLVKVLKNMAFAIIERVVEASEQRLEPACPYFMKCGGCDFWHMSYEEELRAKTERVNNALRRIGGLELQVDSTAGSPAAEAYRNKAHYFIAEGERGVLSGFYRARTHELQAVDRCLIQDPRADACAGALKGWMEKFGVSAYDEKNGIGLLRGLQVRTGAGGTLATVVANAEKLPHESELAGVFKAACPDLSGVVLNTNMKRGNVLLGQENRTIWGEGFVTDRLCGKEFRISPNSFYQINRPQAERLYERAAAFAAPEGKLLLDLYCGIGTIGLSMAGRAERVVGVEIVPQAVEDARENARINGIGNAEFICADAADAARRLSARGLRPDAVIIDPPRKGIDEKLTSDILQMRPERIVYISCDPETLARDLKRLCADSGYKASEAEAFDMFPRCAHVETVCLLSKLNTEHHIKIDLKLDELDLTAAESKATYNEIKQYVLDKFGFKVSQLYIAQVKRKHGIIERDNYNKPKSENPKVLQCPPEKEAAIEDALRHFEMI